MSLGIIHDRKLLMVNWATAALLVRAMSKRRRADISIRHMDMFVSSLTANLGVNATFQSYIKTTRHLF